MWLDVGIQDLSDQVQLEQRQYSGKSTFPPLLKPLTKEEKSPFFPNVSEPLFSVSFIFPGNPWHIFFRPGHVQ